MPLETFEAVFDSCVTHARLTRVVEVGIILEAQYVSIYVFMYVCGCMCVCVCMCMCVCVIRLCYTCTFDPSSRGWRHFGSTICEHACMCMCVCACMYV
jgi:hypothetical protein